MKSVLSTSLTVLLVVTLSFSSLNILFVNSQEDTWIELTPMSTSRYIGGVAVVENRIYVIGGTKDGEYLGTNEMYDPKTDTWTTLSSMPTPRSGFVIAVVQNKIHVIGGIQHSYVPTRVHEVYDTQTDTWTTKQRPPFVYRIGATANVVEDKIYVVSGCTSPYRPWVNTIDNDVYDPITDTWTKKAPIPTSVTNYGSTTLDNKIYIFSGRSIPNNKTYTLTQIYDPRIDTWSNGAPVPLGLNDVGVGAITGVLAPKRIYLINGYKCKGDGGFAFQEDVFISMIYDPISDSWSSDAETINRRGDIVVSEDILYLIDGFNEISYSSFIAKYTPKGYSYPESSSSPSPTPSHEPEFPTTTLVTSVVILSLVVIGILVFFKKIKKN